MWLILKKMSVVLVTDGSVAGCGDEDTGNDGVFFVAAEDGMVTQVSALAVQDITPLHWEHSLGAFSFETEESWRLLFPGTADRVL